MQSMGREAELEMEKQPIFFLTRPKKEKTKEVKQEQKSN